MKKHGFRFKKGQPQYLGRPFFDHQEAKKWPRVRKFLSPDEYIEVKRIFAELEPRFDKIWRKEKLDTWKKKLQRKITNRPITLLIKDMERFLGTSPGQSINVHLIAAPTKKRTAAGGANLGPTDITLEVPIYELNGWNLDYAIAIIIHEFVHLQIETTRISKLIDVALRQMRQPKDLFKEMIVNVIAPYGFLCQKYFKEYKPIEDILLPALIGSPVTLRQTTKEKKLAWLAYPLTNDYIKTGKRIDRRYIDKYLKMVSICNS